MNKYSSEFFSLLTGRSFPVYFSAIEEIYDRSCGPFADYNVNLDRAALTSLIKQSMSDKGTIEDEDGSALTPSIIFRHLESKGWIESYTDSHSLKKAYKFTETAMELCQTLFSDKHGINVAAQHANSVRSHLRVFLEGAKNSNIDINDLMSAARFSGFIINDLNSMIHEIGLCRKKMISMMAEKSADLGMAASAFFEFIEVRFSNGIALSFSRDSVERYKYEIVESILEIERLDDRLKADIESRLQKHYPHLIARTHAKHYGSILLWSLDLIQSQLKNATEVKLPELRSEVSTLTDRAAMALRDIVAINSQKGQNDVFALAASLKQLSIEDIDDLLTQNSSRFVLCQPSFHNPSSVRISDHEKFKFGLIELSENDETPEQKMKHAVDEALKSQVSVSQESLINFVSKAKGKKSVRLSDLPIDNYLDLLCALQIVDLEQTIDNDTIYEVEHTDQIIHTPFFTCNDFIIKAKSR